MSLARMSTSSARNVPLLSSASFWKYAKIAAWPRCSPEIGDEPGTYHTASSAISFLSLSVLRVEGVVEVIDQRRVRMLEHGGPSLATGPPNAGIPERPFYQARPHVLEDRELVPTRILEEQARSRRDLERSAFRLPTAGAQVFRRRFEVPHL